LRQPPRQEPDHVGPDVSPGPNGHICRV
jgi:hypothetical protein